LGHTAGLGALVVGVIALAGPATAQPPEKLPGDKGDVKILPPAKGLPAPTPVPGFGADKVRLPRLGDRGPLGTTPRPTPEDLREIGQFVDTVIDPKNTLDLVQGRTRLVLLKQTPTQTQIADETVASYSLLGQRQLSLLGRRVGTTVLTLWFPDPMDKTKEKIISYLVRVIPDPEEKERLQRVYEELEREIARVFPDSHIKLTLVGDKLVVRGQAKDVAEATQILRIVRANAPGADRDRGRDGGAGGAGDPRAGMPGAPGAAAEADAKKVPLTNINVNFNPGDPTNPYGTPGLESYQASGGPNVINLIRIPGEQQVMLRVTVAEVNRAAARSIGLNFSIINNQGVPVVNQLTGLIQDPTGFAITSIGGAGTTTGAGLSSISGGLGGAGLTTGLGTVGTSGASGLLGQGSGLVANIPVILDNGQIPLAINALRTLNYARSLAEPNLVAMNGRTAQFRSGGQFPVPVIGGFGQFNNGQGGLQGVQFVPFGVSLQFTPVITDRDRIRLNVSAEVSTRDLAAGTQIAGSQVSGLNTRNFTSIVEMREGQTLAVAGLIQNSLGAQAERVPFFGDIPILNRLFAADQITAGEQELLILITPELVHPLEKKELAKLPGSDIFEPDDCEFYLHGRLESHRAMDYRSPVMTDIHRMRAWKRCEINYIFGPVGHTDDPNYPAP
ncbi:MAG TPA: pilus assembly protein N-terminal domain-containing protein, partial [Gemmataceae bacterium]|nr:pilus assembly protein N-terminal domain-containing protein [Gemmataceae bacterium]